MAAKFSDIPNLRYCWNVGEVPPVVDGDNKVLQWYPAYPELDQTAIVIPNPHVDGGTKAPTYEAGQDTCGLAPAINFSEGRYMRLQYTHPAQEYPNGTTLVCAKMRRVQESSAAFAVFEGASYRVMEWPGNQSEFAHVLVRSGNTLWLNAPEWLSEVNVPETTIVTQEVIDGVHGAGTYYFRKQGSARVETALDVQNGLTASSVFDIGNRNNSSYNISGTIAIFAIYDRVLTPQEIVEVEDLCHAWIDNGEAPSTGPQPTSTSFGPVLTNDMSSTLHWEVWLDSDGATEIWRPYTGLPTATTHLETVIMEGGQPDNINNLLVIDSATPADSCQVRCRATTSYTDTTGIITPIDGTTRLSVVEES